jgi:hypothetical protein
MGTHTLNTIYVALFASIIGGCIATIILVTGYMVVDTILQL